MPLVEKSEEIEMSNNSLGHMSCSDRNCEAEGKECGQSRLGNTFCQEKSELFVF